MMQRSLALHGLLAFICFFAGWYTNGLRKEAVISNLNKEYQQAIVRSAEAIRQKELERVTFVEEEKDVAVQKLQDVEADLVASRAAANRLQRELTQLRNNRTCQDTALTDGSSGVPGSDPIGMLIDVLTGMDTTGREVAEYADRLRVAGQTCELVYDGMR